MSKPVFDKNTPEEVVAGFVERVSDLPHAADLVALLPEEHPLYTGRGTNQTARIRGYIIAAFARTGLPETALPFVLDELENGIEAYLTGAAAVALRGTAPSASFIPYLLTAVRNTRYRDDSMTFDCYRPGWPLSNGTTALTEIFRTFAWLGAEGKDALGRLRDFSARSENDFSEPIRAEIDAAIAAIRGAPDTVGESCCTIPPGFTRWVLEAPGAGEIEFEDQDGSTLIYDGFFHGKPSIVAFFYTRCNNPNKCSMTVTKLSRVQKMLAGLGLENDIKTAGVTYDPGFDLPFRLRSYGENRGLVFDEHNKLLRTPNGLAPLQEHFRLGVNFISSIVNRHRIELYILDGSGRVRTSFVRSQWDPAEVVSAARDVLEEGEKEQSSGSRKFAAARAGGRHIAAVMVPFAVIFFPKCPLCWAAYLSLFGITGLASITASPWMLFALVLLMLANLAAIYRRGIRHKDLLPFYLSVLGVFIILLPGMYFAVPYISFLGIALIFIGSFPAIPFFRRQSAG